MFMSLQHLYIVFQALSSNAAKAQFLQQNQAHIAQQFRINVPNLIAYYSNQAKRG